MDSILRSARLRSVGAAICRPYSTGALFLIALSIIVLNFVLAINCPTSHILEDEIAFYDTIWRNVLGYRLGTDYHNPLGFGPFEISALLWRIIGPYEHILKLTNTLLVVPIAGIACITAKRYRALPAPFALVFCVATALELSAPNSFGFGVDPTSLGTSGFYNRISIACLSVLFLHAFSGVNRTQPASRRLIVEDVTIFAVLLLYLFLFKISALVIGCLLIGGGILAYRNKLTGFLIAVTSVIVAALAICLTTFAFGVDPAALAHEYAMAGQAKGIPGATGIYNTLFKDPLNSLNIVLLVFGLCVLVAGRYRNWLVLAAVFVACVASTFLLNLSNEYETIWMFPPALAIMAALAVAGHERGAPSSAERTDPAPSLPGAFPMVALTAFVVVIVGQGLGTITAALSDLAVLAGVRQEVVVTAGKPIAFRTFCTDDGCDYVRSINDGIAILKANGLSDEKIVTLTHSNPFPVLLLSPPHKGTQVWWNFGFNVPKDAKLSWRDVLGDGTVVMIPQHDEYPHVREKLFETVKDKLTSDFALVHSDDNWKVYRLKRARPIS